jgi:hypothetical protein
VVAVYSIQRGGDVEGMLVAVSLRSRSRDNAACGDENNDHRQVRSLSELLYGSMLAGWAATVVSHSQSVRAFALRKASHRNVLRIAGRHSSSLGLHTVLFVLLITRPIHHHRQHSAARTLLNDRLNSIRDRFATSFLAA